MTILRILVPWLFAGCLAAQAPEDGTVVDTSSLAFNNPSPLLSAAERRVFAVGNSLFRANWVTAPASAEGLDGLGPLFNARSCSSCHLRDGRSRPPEPGATERQGLLVRIGVPRPGAADAEDPGVGTQVQTEAVNGAMPEATVELQWVAAQGQYGDGEPFELIAPRYEIRDVAYGALGEGVVVGGRVAPQLIGLGLLEAIPVAALLANSDPDDRDHDGISGRLHRLASEGDDAAIGRFGWKATQPTVHDQVAAAFVHDMGITSTVHPHEPLTPAQRAAIVLPNGGEPEISDEKLARVVFYSRSLAVPRQRDAGSVAVASGERHFRDFGCARCHVPEFTTAPVAFHAAFGGRLIRPYTDLLLHDLGEGLADEKHDGDASPSEWRTPPLWGIGLVPIVNGHTRYLHDGRARGVAEAILWHGGEAEASRRRFRDAPRAIREELLVFVNSL